METIVLEGQSLFDIAVQQAGSIDAVFALAVANDISITDTLEVGQKLIGVPARNQRIADYYRVKGITPATGLSPDENAEGIEFWAIERDFIVSE